MRRFDKDLTALIFLHAGRDKRFYPVERQQTLKHLAVGVAERLVDSHQAVKRLHDGDTLSLLCQPECRLTADQTAANDCHAFTNGCLAEQRVRRRVNGGVLTQRELFRRCAGGDDHGIVLFIECRIGVNCCIEMHRYV